MKINTINQYLNNKIIMINQVNYLESKKKFHMINQDKKVLKAEFRELRNIYNLILEVLMLKIKIKLHLKK
jgi:hypothetical protein